MSQELEYFPPRGTKWTWHSKSLNSSPWVCNLSRQKEPSTFTTPLNVTLYVDLLNGSYVWRVEISDFSYNRSRVEGYETDPLRACKAAEKTGEAKLKELLPKWARTALANQWRPPR